MTDGRTPPFDAPDDLPADEYAEGPDVVADEPVDTIRDEYVDEEASDGATAVDGGESDDREMDDAAFEEKFGDGISDRADEKKTQKRTLALALGGLLIGTGVVIGVLSFVLPDARIPDVRPDLKSRAEAARTDLKDVHRQNLEALTVEGTKSEPTMTVVCGLLPGDAPRKEQCELRATSLLDVKQMRPDADTKTNPAYSTSECTPVQADLEDFKPVLTLQKDGGCKTAAEYRWVTFDGTPRVESAAAWLMEGQLGKGAANTVAITTRHDLGQFDIGDCPENGCGVDQIQVPKVDFKADAVDDQSQR